MLSTEEYLEKYYLRALVVELQDDVTLLRKAVKDMDDRVPVDPDPFNGGAAYTQMRRIAFKALRDTRPVVRAA